MNTSINGSVDGEVESAGATATKTHVGNTTLEALLASLGLLDVSLGRPLDTFDDVGHGTRAVGAEDLDGVDVGLLSNTVFLTGNSTRAVSTVTIAIYIFITFGDGLAPVGTTFKVNMVGVGAGVDDVRINTLTTILGVEVLVKGTEGEAITVRDTGQTPGSVFLNGGGIKVVDLRVLLNVVDLELRVDESVSAHERVEGENLGELATHIRMPADLFNDIFMEMTSITHQ